jgi:hypothetical protein
LASSTNGSTWSPSGVVGLGSVPGLLKDRNGVLLCLCRPVPVEHRPGDGFQPLGALRELSARTSRSRPILAHHPTIS